MRRLRLVTAALAVLLPGVAAPAAPAARPATLTWRPGAFSDYSYSFSLSPQG